MGPGAPGHAKVEVSRETRPKVSLDGSGLAKPAMRWVSPVGGTGIRALTARSNGEQNAAHSERDFTEFEMRHRANERSTDLWMLM